MVMIGMKFIETVRKKHKTDFKVMTFKNTYKKIQNQI
jgi:hypothetical protein